MIIVVVLALPLVVLSVFIAGGLAAVAPSHYSFGKRTAVGFAGFLFLPAIATFCIAMAELFKK